MPRTILLLIGGLAAGLAISQIIDWRAVPSATPEDHGAALAATDQSGLGRRIAELEDRLAVEIEQREVLAEELSLLADTLAAQTSSGEVRDASSARPNPQGGPAAPEFRRRFERFPDAGDRAERRREALIDAGFAPDRAAALLRREGELRMEAMYRRYEALRESGSAEQPFAGFGRDPATNALRQELGDVDYDRYLYATGQPNRVRVAEVIDTSPAAQAGLKAGDLIVSYGGERVFNFGELMALTAAGQPGELVAIDVVRDGTRTQLYLPRGPIGMIGGRRARIDPDNGS